MKNLSDVGNNQVNVIALGHFRKNEKHWETIPNEILFPASKNFSEADDDPLEDLLHEFDSILETPVWEESKIEKDFIFHHNNTIDYRVSYKDSLRDMADKLEQQIRRIKEDSKRIKYYLDEME